MNTRRIPMPLAATALAVLSLTLAACGGGNGEPPPQAGGNTVTAAAPVVTITNNVSAETATGDITFTFSFNRDVGTSFTADDVAVTGGTKGAFTRVSGTSATLVVTPTPNTTGTVAVTVAAGGVSDAVGTGNAATSASKAFNTVAPPPPAVGPVVLANFDSVTPPAAGFEGAEGSGIETGPAGGGSGRSFKVLRSGGQFFALGIIDTTVPFTTARRTISAQVFSPAADVPMVLKIEGPGGANTGEVRANEPVVAGWQTLTWTFSGVNPAQTFNKIVLLPNLGTVDAAPGRSYYFDDIRLVPDAAGGAPLVFSSGFGAGNRTLEGGEYDGFSGSNLDGFGCNRDPANCGGGGEFAPALAAENSYFFYYYQTPTPATALYMGVYVQAPGVVGGFSAGADTAGVQVGSQTQLKFKLGQNNEWFTSGSNNFMIVMDLGKRFAVGTDPACRLQLRRVVTPTAAAATDYAIPLSSFSLVQNCGGAATSVADALSKSPVSQISFQGVGGSIALSDGTRTSGANLTVPNGSVYPTTVVLVGGIRFE